MIQFQPVAVAIEGDGDGRLIFADGRLTGVAVRLSGEHGDLAGRWFLEAVFGRAQAPTYPVFDALEDIAVWFEARL